MAYTGLPLPTGPGVSISIGYAGELYIDFGVLGMMAGMGILGFFYGKANRYIQRISARRLLVMEPRSRFSCPDFTLKHLCQRLLEVWAPRS